MIEFLQQGDTCEIKGQLRQTEVIDLWPKRQQLFTDSTQVLDLSALEYADSAGVAFLLELICLGNCSKSTTQPRTLANPSQHLKRLIELYDLESFFLEN
ncbi:MULTISPECIES: STAS domain-containing protein [Shewanella]|uniref:STAS domain-containing protein n=1 Tax=Shewanella TaxID=22 RepID=UPI001BBE3CE9|nr:MULTISPECIES: STAS domain-containing protein [Shewanella]GIU48634.1 ABC phospholipid uptake (salvage) system anti-anti-sigma factor MlaB [Shewanella sp. KT0246]